MYMSSEGATPDRCLGIAVTRHIIHILPIWEYRLSDFRGEETFHSEQCLTSSRWSPTLGNLSRMLKGSAFTADTFHFLERSQAAVIAPGSSSMWISGALFSEILETPVRASSHRTFMRNPALLCSSDVIQVIA